MSALLDALARRVLVADGAMGTMLHAAGVSLDRVLPELNVTSPRLVSEVHREYVAAGADLILTNTFRASRRRLTLAGIGSQFEEVNRAGVEIAKAAADRAGRPVFVGGSIGPVFTGGQWLAESLADRVAVLVEQAELLADAGVDALVFETFGDAAELAEAASACAGLGLPVIAQLTFVEDHLTPAGQSPEESVALLKDTGATAIGVNCSLGPQGIRDVLARFSGATTLPLCAQPNAGLPRMIGRRQFKYRVDHDYFARNAVNYAELGASIVGGCCGTTPEHMNAVSRAIGDRKPYRLPIGSDNRAEGVKPSSGLGSWLERRPAFGGNAFPIGVEIQPPAGADPGAVLHLAQESIEAGADFLVVARSSTSRAQMSALSVATMLRLHTSVDVAVQVTTWDRSLISLQADLLGALACGVTTIVCRTGNPPLQGDYPNLGGIWDVDSIGLIRLLKSLNSGLDSNGTPIRMAATFSIGARINLGAIDVSAETTRTVEKLRAGSEFLVTWPLYDSAALCDVLKRLQPNHVPTLLTLQPIRDREEAEFLRHEVPDIYVPESTVERLGPRSSGWSAGMDLTVEVLEGSMDQVDGVVLVRRDELPSTWAELIMQIRKMTETKRAVDRRTGSVNPV